MICTPHQLLFKRYKYDAWDEQCRWPIWGTGEVPTKIWWGNLRERYHLENLGVDERII